MSTAPSSAPARRGGIDRRPGRVLQVGPVDLVELPQAVEVEEAVDLVDVLGGQVELPHQQVADLVGHAGMDLEADGVPEAAPAELHLDGGQQVVGLLVGHAEVGVAGDPERAVQLDLHAGKQPVEVGGDHLLEGHEARAVGGPHEPGQQRRHLDPGEAALVALGVADHDGQVERQVGDVGERVAGVDRQRREDGEDLVLEVPPELLLVLLLQRRPVEEPDPGVGQQRLDLVAEDVGLAEDQLLGPLADRTQLLVGVEPAGGGGAEAGGGPVGQPRHPDHEELVEVAGEDGQELHPFQQGELRGPRPRPAPGR